VSGKRPFDGLRVIDTTQVLAGPYAGYQFAVLGADVVKVESPKDPDFVRSVGTDPALNDIGMGTQFLTQNAGKRFLALDLKAEAGREVLRRLVATADVFLQNYRPGAFEQLGLGYADLAAINPRLVYCSSSCDRCARARLRSTTPPELPRRSPSPRPCCSEPAPAGGTTLTWR